MNAVMTCWMSNFKGHWPFLFSVINFPKWIIFSCFFTINNQFVSWCKTFLRSQTVYLIEKYWLYFSPLKWRRSFMTNKLDSCLFQSCVRFITADICHCRKWNVVVTTPYTIIKHSQYNPVRDKHISIKLSPSRKMILMDNGYIEKSIDHPLFS